VATICLLDVREKTKCGPAILMRRDDPRGFLEFQVAGQIPNTDKDVVVYCAGGATLTPGAQSAALHGYDG